MVSRTIDQPIAADVAKALDGSNSSSVAVTPVSVVGSESGTATATSVSVAIPAGIAENDTILYLAHSRNATFDEDGPAGSGWVRIYGVDPFSDEQIMAWQRPAGVGESGSIAYSFTSTGTTGVIGVIVVLRDVGSIFGAVKGGGLLTPSAIGRANAIALAHLGSVYSPSETISAVPTGMTLLESDQAGPGDTRVQVSYKESSDLGEVVIDEPANDLTSIATRGLAGIIMAYPVESASMFAVVSDTHIGNLGALNLTRLGHMVDEINESPASLVVVNGDFYEDGTDSTTAQDIIDAKALMDGLEASSLYYGLGNHDNENGDSVTDMTSTKIGEFYDAVGDTVLSTAERERGYYSFSENGITHLILNSCMIQPAGAGLYEFGTTQKTWITNTLAALTASGVRLVVHTHVDPNNDTNDDLCMSTTDRAFIKDELAGWVAANASSMLLAVFTGHEHGLNNAGETKITSNQGITYFNKVDGHLIDGTHNIKANAGTDSRLDWHLCAWNEATEELVVMGRGFGHSYTIKPAQAGNTLLTGNERFWSLDDAGAATVSDGAGNDDLAKTGTVTGAAGKVGNAAVRATGANYYSGSTVFSAPIEELSAAGWFKIAARGVLTSNIVAQYLSTGNDRGFSLHVSNIGGVDAPRAYISHDGISEALILHGTDNLDDGAWHHAAFTFRRGVARLYIDGDMRDGGNLDKERVSTVYVPTGRASAQGAELGTLNAGTAWDAASEIDEVGVWSVALSPRDVYRLYQETTYASFS